MKNSNGNCRTTVLALGATLLCLFAAASAPSQVKVSNPAGRPVLVEGKKPLAMSGYSPIYWENH